MKLYALIWSPTGGTARVAKALCAAWAGETETVDLFTDPAAAARIAFAADDVCLAVVPSFGGRVPALAVDALQQAAGSGARAIPVVVYGNRAIDDTLTELIDVLAAAGFCCIAAMDAVAEHSIFRQYAAGRPDAADIAELQAFMRRIQAALSDGTAKPLTDVPGNRPYKTFGGSSFKPIAVGNCTLCGLCAAQCPVQAIPENDPKGVDAQRCISCMHCIAICPVGARGNVEPQFSQAAEKSRERFAGRKENHLYLG